ncbi:MAG TPA: NUDIX domain-containing protein [Rhodanobacteraceae bacterium]|nr:NUDIX domain-containing protein [Rhodanobacteraceae bacterium]
MVSVVTLRGDSGQQRALMLRRAGNYLNGAWSYVAGHVEPNETGWQAACRELAEETGLAPKRLYATSFCEQFYSAADDCIEIVPAFVAMVATDAGVHLNGEHSAFRWLPFDAAMVALPFGSQRDLFAYVRREFVDRPPSEFLRIAMG